MIGANQMKITDLDISKQAFVYAAIHMLANRMQTLGDKIDPTVSSKQWFVLAVVLKFDATPPNIGDVADALGTSRQNIKKIANILEKRGFLRLEKDEKDLRSIRLFLTEQCYKYLKGREQQENEYLKRIFSELEEEEVTVLCKGLGKLLKNLDNLLEWEDE